MDHLKDRFFLTFTGVDVDHQGQVVTRVSDEVFLVRWHSWVTGAPTHEALVPIQEMMDWQFYEDEEDWRDAGEKESAIAARRRKPPG